MIGIIGAMQVELDALKAKMNAPVSKIMGGVEFVQGELCGKEVVLAKCGIGKVAAALCAQVMILQYNADIIINTGVAGTLHKDIGVLDFAISTAVVQHDMDTTAIGDAPGLISGINIVEIPASSRLCDIACRVGREQGNKCLPGIIASGDQFINSKEKKNYIQEQFGAIACEMEGAAIGQTCYLYGVDFLVIRCISDNASGNAEMEYPELVARAAVKSQMLTESMLKLV